MGPYGSSGYTLDFVVAADLQYGTHYWSEQGDATAAIPSLHTEAYGLHIYPFISLEANLDFDQMGTYTVLSTFYPFYIVPYEQRFSWTRPDGGYPLAIYAAGSRTV